MTGWDPHLWGAYLPFWAILLYWGWLLWHVGTAWREWRQSRMLQAMTVAGVLMLWVFAERQFGDQLLEAWAMNTRGWLWVAVFAAWPARDAWYTLREYRRGRRV